MANLKTNNLCGEGGTNAYRGSVFFNGRDTISGTQVIAAESNDDFKLGTGDFALEMWIYPAVVQSKTLYDGRRASSDVAMHIDLSSNVVRYMTNNNARITGSSTLAVNSWHHISVERSSGSTKLYVNGVQEGSTYSDNNDLVAKLNRPIIGSSYNMGSTFKGYISNLRLCKGHTVYGAAFTPPTSELVVHDKTVLLCCQDSDNPLQEATGKEMLGQGGNYFGRRFSNLATNGDLETGATTNWANGGCDTFEISNFSNSGSYSIHAVTNSNGDAIVYTIPVTLDAEKRYKISAYVNVVGPSGTTARAKMKIGAGTGGNENYESEVVGQHTPQRQWAYIEWIGMATADTTHVTFNESSANNVNDYYVDDLRIELWYPEEGVNILGNNRFKDNATGWTFTSGNSPSTEWSIASNKLTLTDTSRTNDAIASQQILSQAVAEGRYRFTIDYSISVGDFDIGFGSRRYYGIRSTFNGGAGNDATVTYEIEADDNSSFRIVGNQYCAGDFNDIHLSRVPEPKAPKVIPPYGVDAGNTFGGAISMNSLDYMYFPTGRTEERGRGVGLYAGGTTPSNDPTPQIASILIQSSGNSIQFGDLSVARYVGGTGASSTRGIFAGGATPTRLNTIDFVTIATQGNATNFGDTQQVVAASTGASNSTRMVNAGGDSPSPTLINVIDLITIATIGDATNFGDLSVARPGLAGGASPTRGVFGGGWTAVPAYTSNDTIDYITIATTGNATDFGNLTSARRSVSGGSSQTRAIFMGGLSGSNPSSTKTNTIDFVTIASTGNATDFGDLTATVRDSGQTMSNSIRACKAGGYNSPATVNSIDMVTIATTGNAADFGDTAVPVFSLTGLSDSHGGL